MKDVTTGSGTHYENKREDGCPVQVLSFIKSLVEFLKWTLACEQAIHLWQAGASRGRTHVLL